MESLYEILHDDNFRSEFILGISIGFCVTSVIALFVILIANEEGWFDAKPNTKKIN